eukprot:gnl/MRDRNA2_/MRDRNA2_239279_c0_seq1.p1 gnl/MRDRNA2_/MRDRNA2_239279_c0~~gnl/MRDRNA2_/MRDRNA2_239279_c0_seq1.p1  ORF type:complete len:245 (+),score=34.85 gnl/MRDRNA2_/MRDRNA2_239279_c0_seq1:65-736(+)
MGVAFTSLRTLMGAYLQGQHEPITVMGRTGYVYKPAATETEGSRQVPGIFVLHGSGGVAPDMFNKGFEALADAHGFLVVYPEMKIPRADEWGYHDDIPYFTALVQRLQENDYHLDPARAFICGHSAGASFTLFFQNEVDLFKASGAVEGAVGNLEKWDMSKPGHPVMVIWNHADPVLEAFAPPGGEPAYYKETVSTLRRHGSQTFTKQPLPTSKTIVSADVLL